MVNEHFIRKYTTDDGNYPFNWRVVGEGDIANASVNILRYFRELKKQVPENLRSLFDVRVEKTEFEETYHFGASSVTFDTLDKAPLTIEGGSREGLLILLKAAELLKFEPKERRR